MPKVWITYFSSYVISVKNHRIIEYRVMRYLSNHLGNFLCSIHKCHLQYLLPFIFHSLLELLKWTLWSTINCASLWNKWRLHGRINILSLLHEPESVTLCASFQLNTQAVPVNESPSRTDCTLALLPPLCEGGLCSTPHNTDQCGTCPTSGRKSPRRPCAGTYVDLRMRFQDVDT